MNLRGSDHAPSKKQVTEMDVDMAATIAWCLMGSVMVGAALMYACLHRLVTEAYEAGRQHHLDGVPATAKAVPDQEAAVDRGRPSRAAAVSA